MDLKEPLPEPERGFHGVLRYRRESEWGKIVHLPPSATEHTVWCEYCGAEAKPLLDFSRTPNPEDFCCARYMKMFKKVEKQWHSLQEHSGELQEQDANARDKAGSQDILQQVSEECLKKGKRLSSDPEMPGCKVTSSGFLTTIMFRLSDFVRVKEYKRSTATDNNVREETPMASMLCSTDGSFPARFGLCHYQGHIQRFYSNGSRFLTALLDGTTQVCYPSGNLAIIAFTDDTERVCVVLDDTRSSCPIRAFFQSSGIAACYHSNGSTWLHTDAWGGLSLNQDHSRSRKWSWTDNSNNQRPFKPIHLSLNKNIGVRVWGQQSVVVTFLAQGQQARFSVGSGTQPSKPAPPWGTEELMLRVIQLNARLALERLRWCLDIRSGPRCSALRIPPTLISQGRRLLRLSSGMRVDEKDRDYIQHCLRDCQ